MASDADAPVLSNKSQGRKKIEMKLIKKKTARMVTFSKRRASLFRKASELATLCNAHLAIMIFSPGGKIYSFGHPTVGAVLQRYESSSTQFNHYNRADEFMRLAALKAENTLRLKMELQQTLDDIQAKKEKIKMLDMVWEKDHATRYCWWNAPVEEMDMACCKALEEKLKELKVEVEAELKIRNQAEKDSKKNNVTINEATPSKQIVAPNHSAPIINNLVAGWINSAARSAQNYMSGPSNAAARSAQNYMSGPSNAAAAAACASNMTDFLGTDQFYKFGGGQRTSTATMTSRPSSSTKSYGVGVGSNPTNFSSFPF